MSNGSSGIIFRKEVTHPRDGQHPGFGYRVERDGNLVIERDVAVPMRDGVKLYCDIIRPADQTNLPVILTYSPYGKHGLKKFLFSEAAGVPPGYVSKYAVWEDPDPAFFAEHGYAVVNADARGSWYSEGDLTIWSDQEAQDGYDLVEWCATLPWSNGRVGMTGVSYLAVVQWRIAALNPPHLYAVNPWEGWSDCYRERTYHGGIPETRFVPWGQWSTSFSLTRSEDFVTTAAMHPLFDEYWEGKRANLAAIRVPAYIVADWGDHGLHTRGTIEGFRQASSKSKWLEVHGRKKWQYYYQPKSRERLKIFFDHFLKDVSDEVLSWPPVRIEIRDRYYVGKFRDEKEWPLARTRYEPLFLNADTKMMQMVPISGKTSARYDAKTGSCIFDFKFAEETELTGYMKLKLWVEAVGSNDADLFVAVQKLDQDGEMVPFTFWNEFDNGPVALGWLRASHRELDPDRSTPYQPWHSHKKELLLKPNEIVPIEIEILPSSTLFKKGETLRLLVQGSDIYPLPTKHSVRHEQTRNKGEHVIHVGGSYDSHLLVPIVSNG